MPADLKSSLFPHSEKISTTVILIILSVRIYTIIIEYAACSIFQFFIVFTTHHFLNGVIILTDNHSEAIELCSIRWSFQLKNKLPALSLQCVGELLHPVCYFSTSRTNTFLLCGKPVLDCLFVHLKSSCKQSLVFIGENRWVHCRWVVFGWGSIFLDRWHYRIGVETRVGVYGSILSAVISLL